jgi:tRNA modification GTPase
MEFSLTSDTIAAICSAPGEGAIAVVRLSGPKAKQIASKLLGPQILEMGPQTARVGWLRDLRGQPIDQVVCLFFQGPRSFTGEDVIELQTHGGYLVPKQVLRALLEAGARAATPGEFSSRALLNGKMDLAQAEAIQSLIGARNELAVKAAQQALSGRLSSYLQERMSRLFDLAGILEAWVDFPEEDLEFASFDEVAASLEAVCQDLEYLKSTYRHGQRLVEGLTICLAGVPNAGKSSLLNTLLGRDRAIVTDIAGTTRDLLESEWRVGGIHVRLIDTAGIRSTEETIEAEGIRRSRQAVEEADIVLAVFDASRADEKAQQELLTELPAEKAIFVLNKCDLVTPRDQDTMISQLPEGSHWVAVSATTGQGMASLLQQLEQRVWHGAAPVVEELILTQERHVEAIGNAICAFRSVVQGLRQGLSAEYVALEMRSGLQSLRSITGENLSESILSAIFSRFCLGK